jgi:hypothetical protein
MGLFTKKSEFKTNIKHYGGNRDLYTIYYSVKTNLFGERIWKTIKVYSTPNHGVGICFWVSLNIKGYDNAVEYALNLTHDSVKQIELIQEAKYKKYNTK